MSHFAAHGLLKNEAIIIVATKPHWENIAGRLTNKGFDIEELRRAGQLTLLDADETLPKFLVKDMPDGRTLRALLTIRSKRRGQMVVMPMSGGGARWLMSSTSKAMARVPLVLKSFSMK